MKYQDHCGCCGCEIPHGEWCLPCSKHLSADRSLPPWERTFFAQYGKYCPYEIQERQNKDKEKNDGE